MNEDGELDYSQRNAREFGMPIESWQMIREFVSGVPPLPLINEQCQLNVDPSNLLALSGNLPLHFHGVPANFDGNQSIMPMQLQTINNMQAPVLAMPGKAQCITISGRKDAVNPNFGNQNSVTTGLSQYHDLAGRNSSLLSVNEAFPSLSNDLRFQSDLQSSELHYFVAEQGEKLAKGIHAMTKRHRNALKAALEEAYAQKLYEKDLELASVVNRNKQLSETIKQQAAEARKWRRIATYNESVVKNLKHSLQEALGKEGFGEHDPASNECSTQWMMSDTGCRCCGVNRASVLLMPCKHLCLCAECDLVVNVCPVCTMAKASSFQVYPC